MLLYLTSRPTQIYKGGGMGEANPRAGVGGAVGRSVTAFAD